MKTSSKAVLESVPIPSWASGWGIEELDGVELRFATVHLGRIGSSDVHLRMHWIPGGTFQMGSPETEKGRFSDEIRHEVTLRRGFWLGQFPVTQQEYECLTGDSPSEFKGGRLPVESVDWFQAMEFVRRLNERLEIGSSGDSDGFAFRLPTEAEWERACRAGTDSAFNDGSDCTQPTGKDPALEKLGWYDKNSDNQTHPVGEKRSNGWGLYDMHGNIWEWCLDYADWEGSVRTDTYVPGAVDPLCRTGAGRVVRGGSSWGGAWWCRSALRNASEPGGRDRFQGFRLAAGPVLPEGA